MFEGISGHEKQREFLSKAFERGKLAHGYVFAGPNGVGKKMLAWELAWKLLAPSSAAVAEEKKEGNKFHPDLIEIGGTDGIKIEQIRDLTYKLSLMPYSAPNKVAIIDGAENITTEAANALLKTLEEPKNYTYIFLITSNPQKLPKTILSRCQKMTFGPLPVESDKSEASEQQETFLKILKNGVLEDKLIAAYEIAELENIEIKNLMDYWLKNLEKDLMAQATVKLATKIKQVALARRYLEQNVNVKLLLTHLMLNV